MTILNFLEEPQQLQNKLMKQSSLMQSQKKKPNLLLKSSVIQLQENYSQRKTGKTEHSH